METVDAGDGMGIANLALALTQTNDSHSTLNASCRGSFFGASQRSLHTEPIFRLLLKVAVNGTHQCDFFNF